jgi:hypothetical protein
VQGFQWFVIHYYTADRAAGQAECSEHLGQQLLFGFGAEPVQGEVYEDPAGPSCSDDRRTLNPEVQLSSRARSLSMSRGTVPWSVLPPSVAGQFGQRQESNGTRIGDQRSAFAKGTRSWYAMSSSPRTA